MVVLGHWLLNGRDRDIRLDKNSITFWECQKTAQNIHSPESLLDFFAFVFSLVLSNFTSIRLVVLSLYTKKHHFLNVIVWRHSSTLGPNCTYFVTGIEIRQTQRETVVLESLNIQAIEKRNNFISVKMASLLTSTWSGSNMHETRQQ